MLEELRRLNCCEARTNLSSNIKNSPLFLDHQTFLSLSLPLFWICEASGIGFLSEEPWEVRSRRCEWMHSGWWIHFQEPLALAVICAVLEFRFQLPNCSSSIECLKLFVVSTSIRFLSARLGYNPFNSPEYKDSPWFLDHRTSFPWLWQLLMLQVVRLLDIFRLPVGLEPWEESGRRCEKDAFKSLNPISRTGGPKVICAVLEFAFQLLSCSFSIIDCLKLVLVCSSI